MSDLRPVLLLTRPEAAAQRFAGQVAAMTRTGFETVISPLMRIAPIEGRVELGGATGVILTSVHALPALEAADPDRRCTVFAVGAATAAAAERSGFTAHAMGGDAAALVDRLITRAVKGPLVHLHGRHSRGDVAARLTAAGIETVEQVVYDQIAEPLSETAQAALNGDAPVILPLFSPRSAMLASEVVQGRAPLHVVSISAATASAAAQLARTGAVTVPHPNAVEMAQAVAGLLDAVSRLEGPEGAQ